MTDLRQTYLDELIFRTNMLIDSNASATFAEVHKVVEDGTVLEWLRDKGADMSIILSETMSDTKVLVVEALKEVLKQAASARKGQERRKLGVQNHGLCLLIALALEAKAIMPPVTSPYIEKGSLQ